MKKSVVIHGISIVAMTLGDGGRAFRLTQSHLYQDAINLQLIALSVGMCAIYAAEWSRKEKL